MTEWARGVSWLRELENAEGDASNTTGFRGSRRCQDCFPPSLGSTFSPVSFTLRKALGTWRTRQTRIYILSVQQLPGKEGASILVVAANSQTWLLAHSEPITGARRAGYGITLRGALCSTWTRHGGGKGAGSSSHPPKKGKWTPGKNKSHNTKKHGFSKLVVFLVILLKLIHLYLWDLIKMRDLFLQKSADVTMSCKMLPAVSGGLVRPRTQLITWKLGNILEVKDTFRRICIAYLRAIILGFLFLSFFFFSFPPSNSIHEEFPLLAV